MKDKINHSFALALPVIRKLFAFSMMLYFLWTQVAIADELLGGLASMDVGTDYGCAINADGEVKCWGYNSSGQLGDGTTRHTNIGVVVTGLAGSAVAVSAGTSHACAIISTGALQCWGSNGSGQLGDGTTNDSGSAVNVTGLSSGVAAVSAGGEHTCAVLSTGALKCWGDNYSGQLGNATNTSSSNPVDVSGLSSDVTRVSAGEEHTCAVSTGGALRCWGNNYYGQLGDGTEGSAGRKNVPTLVSGLSATDVAAGYSHTCAVLIGVLGGELLRTIGGWDDR